MEIIRKRRDALNAKAAQSAAFNYSALVLAASSSASPPSGVLLRDEFSSASLGGMGMPPPRDTPYRVPTQHVPPPMHSRERTECVSCGTKITAEWRRGPDGPRSLCNSCGVSSPLHPCCWKRSNGVAAPCQTHEAAADQRPTHWEWGGRHWSECLFNLHAVCVWYRPRLFEQRDVAASWVLAFESVSDCIQHHVVYTVEDVL